MRSILTLAIAGLLLAGCRKDKEVTTDPNFIEFRATYNNADGSPTLRFQPGDLPARLRLNPSSSFVHSGECQKSMACLNLSDIRVEENGTPYEFIMENAETFEVVNGSPLRDLDNKLSISPVKTLDYVLVLDIGRSLGGNEALIKQYAGEFIDRIAANAATKSRVGLVVFSDVIESFKLSSDYAAAKAFIQSRKGGSETKLYQAVDTGLSLLEGSNAEAMALITFTDGLNNSWTDSNLYQSIDHVKNRLGSPIGGKFVSTYTIGLKGHPTYSPDEKVLKDLTRNGGISLIGKTAGEMDGIFKKMATSVSSVYTFTYSRNTSRLSAPIDLLFKLQLKSL
ncbi:vWA domain-containing protein [Dyadobacter crusticola]|uniref:vWA domain-containing protein n=1 Tax=Dyadobacter crusticola TaxID=292407 RepID=UPI0004E13CC7|nr:vWA domain-containing protein [Dyadobacter crusticola]